MPRRRPAQVRADVPIRRTRPARQIPGVPKSVMHGVRRWERQRLWPDAVAEAFEKYRRFVHQPGRILYGLPGGCCPCCVDYYGLPEDPRAVLHEALTQMAGRKARKLRRMVAELDARFLMRSLPDPWAPAQWPWWRRRCLW